MSFERFTHIVVFGLLMLNSVFFTVLSLALAWAGLSLYGLMCWQVPVGLAVALINIFAALIFVSHLVAALMPNTSLLYTSPER